MELLTQIWQSVGLPLTIFLWVYIVIVIIALGGIVVGIGAIWWITWKDRKNFRGTFKGIRGKW